MTDQCGTPHHHYPETLCTEPPGHYRPDRDSHAGPLIIDGRECGAAVWDEPKDSTMTDQAWRTDPRERLIAAIDQTWAYGELAATPEQLVDDYAHHLAEKIRGDLDLNEHPGEAIYECEGCATVRAAALIDPKEQR